MNANLLIAPATEPLSLAEAKAFLRVEHAEEDALIGDLIAAARAQVEMRTRLRLVTQTWRVFFRAWPRDGLLRVGFGPLREVIAARLSERGGDVVTLDAEAFVIDVTHPQPAIAFVPGTLAEPDPAQTIEVDVAAGYGEAADVPDALRQAIRLLVAHWYERRGVLGDDAARVPEAFHALIAPYRSLSL